MDDLMSMVRAGATLRDLKHALDKLRRGEKHHYLVIMAIIGGLIAVGVIVALIVKFCVKKGCSCGECSCGTDDWDEAEDVCNCGCDDETCPESSADESVQKPDSSSPDSDDCPYTQESDFVQ